MAERYESDPLELTLRRAYGDGPAPDPARLAAILREVEAAVPVRQARGRRRWLPWLLLAGTLAAAAGIGRYWQDGQEAVPSAAQPQPRVEERKETEPAATPLREEGEAAIRPGRSTVIYRD